jgi:hypothetical protein
VAATTQDERRHRGERRQQRGGTATVRGGSDTWASQKAGAEVREPRLPSAVRDGTAPMSRPASNHCPGRGPAGCPRMPGECRVGARWVPADVRLTSDGCPAGVRRVSGMSRVGVQKWRAMAHHFWTRRGVAPHRPQPKVHPYGWVIGGIARTPQPSLPIVQRRGIRSAPHRVPFPGPSSALPRVQAPAPAQARRPASRRPERLADSSALSAPSAPFDQGGHAAQAPSPAPSPFKQGADNEPLATARRVDEGPHDNGYFWGR